MILKFDLEEYILTAFKTFEVEEDKNTFSFKKFELTFGSKKSKSTFTFTTTNERLFKQILNFYSN